MAVAEPPTKPSLWGWELPELLSCTGVGEKGMLPSLPFHRDFQLPLPWPVLELVWGLTRALAEPARCRHGPCTSKG